MSKPWPPLNSDEEAERFVAEADLSEYDFSVGHWARLEKTAGKGADRLSITLSDEDLDQAIRLASEAGLDLDAYLGRLVHEQLNRKAA